MSLPDNVRVEKLSFLQLEEVIKLFRQDELLTMLKFNDLKESMLDGDTIEVVMTDTDIIIGAIWYCSWESDSRGIESIVVDAEHRNKGIGSLLLKLVEPNEIHPRNYMSVADDNFRGLSFLKKRGYIATREVKFDDDIRYVMQKDYDIPVTLELKNRLKWRST